MEKVVKSHKFFCPIGDRILWHRGLEYKECPLFSAFRNMPECATCKLKFDGEWSGKGSFEDKFKKKKRKKQYNKKSKRRKR